MSYSPINRALGRSFLRAAQQPATIQSEHAIIEGVLQQIEALADALPILPTAATIKTITMYLREAIPAHCRKEEQFLLSAGGDAAAALPAMALLNAEHEANESAATELAELLEAVSGQSRAADPEPLGLVARQYFTLMRRHMAWEEYLVENIWLEISD